MKLNDHPGFKRLAVLITLVSSVIAYILLYVIARNWGPEEAFVIFPIISVIIALFTYVFVRIAYWVADGFRKGEEEEEMKEQER